MPPAAGAFRGGGAHQCGLRFGTRFQFQTAQNEKFLQFRLATLQLGEQRSVGDGQRNGSLKRVADELLFARRFHGLRDNTTQGEEFFKARFEIGIRQRSIGFSLTGTPVQELL